MSDDDDDKKPKDCKDPCAKQMIALLRELLTEIQAMRKSLHAIHQLYHDEKVRKTPRPDDL